MSPANSIARYSARSVRLRVSVTSDLWQRKSYLAWNVEPAVTSTAEQGLWCQADDCLHHLWPECASAMACRADACHQPVRCNAAQEPAPHSRLNLATTPVPHQHVKQHPSSTIHQFLAKESPEHSLDVSKVFRVVCKNRPPMTLFCPEFAPTYRACSGMIVSSVSQLASLALKPTM